MDYKETMAFIGGAERFGSRLGLERIGRLAELLGRPQDRLRFVHIAGTNGKGSVSAFMSSILTEAGFKTGLFTSPHLERFSERIVIDGKEISEEDIGLAGTAVRLAVREMDTELLGQPTEFEIVTAMALHHFSKQSCELVVLETGLGGRLDATNIIDTPEVAVITAIGRDHTGTLGETLSEIAYEKCGIIKPGGRVVTYRQERQAARVIEDVCAQRGARLTQAAFGQAVSWNMDGQIFRLEDGKDLEITLLGEHQINNASLAVKAIEALSENEFAVSEDNIKSGLIKAKWPGRFEIVRKNPYIVLDGAHNIQGVQSFVRAYRRCFGERKAGIVMGVLSDKDYMDMLKEAAPIAKGFYTVSPKSARTLPADTLAEIIEKCGYRAESFCAVSQALEKALADCEPEGAICFFGSLYFIGEARSILLA